MKKVLIWQVVSYVMAFLSGSTAALSLHWVAVNGGNITAAITSTLLPVAGFLCALSLYKGEKKKTEKVDSTPDPERNE